MTANPIFCRDGVLRLRHHAHDARTGADYPLLLPVEGIERVRRKPLFLGLLNRCVALEDGITVLEVMANLRPWASTVSQLAETDLLAFLAEAHAPARGTPDEAIVAIEIRWVGEISVEYRYADDGGDPFDRMRRIPGSRSYEFLPGERLGAKGLRFQACWEALGRYGTPQRLHEDSERLEEHCSLLGYPANLWAHLPVTIVPDGELADLTDRERDLGKRAGLFRPQAVGYTRLPSWPELHLSLHEPSLFDAVILGLIRPMGFFGSPEDRDAVIDDIRQDAASLDRARQEEQSARAAGPDAVADLERRIQAEEEARKRDRGFAESSLEAIEMAHRIEALRPGWVQAPNGIPD